MVERFDFTFSDGIGLNLVYGRGKPIINKVMKYIFQKVGV